MNRQENLIQILLKAEKTTYNTRISRAVKCQQPDNPI